jgi:choline-glycine betaine transporter
LEIDGEFTASMNILLFLLLLFVLMTGCVYFVLASFISAVGLASKEEHLETICLVVK